MNTANELQLETLSESGRAPASRVKDATAVQEISSSLEKAYLDGPGKVNAKVKGCLDGNAPVAQRDLDELGLGWTSNLNFRLLESDSSFAQVPYYAVFSEVPNYCTVRLDPTFGSPWNREQWQTSISEEHFLLMQEWKGFDYQMQLSIASRVNYGFGPLYYPDKEDPRFKAARHNEVFLPQDSSLDSSEWEVACIVRSETVTALFKSVDNPNASEAGWTPSVAKDAIRKACNDTFQKTEDWEAWQTRVRHNDLYYAVAVPKVRLANVFVKEFTGKISHYIVSEGNTSNPEYLFQYRDRFENWNQILHLMHGEIADGYVGGVKGLCVKAFNFRDTQNRLKNATVNAAFVGSQVLLQAETSEAEDALDIIPMGPYARLPMGVKFSQNPLGSTMDKPLLIDRQMESDLARNLGAYRQNLTDSQGQAVTATEAEINHSVQQTISQQQHNLFVSQLDDLYEEQMRRLTVDIRKENGVDYADWEQMIIRFQARCISRGVPPEALKKIIQVRSFRALGQGSRYYRNQIHEKILSVFPMLPEGVRERHLRNYISGLGSREYLDAIWPEVELTSRADDHMSKAVDEHGTALDGFMPLWTPTQDSVAHLKVHIPFMQGQIQAVLQGQGDPMRVMQLWAILGPHIQETLGHVQTNANIPSPYKMFNDIRHGEFKKFWNDYRELEGVFKQLAQQMAAQQQAQEQEQQAQLAQMQQAQAAAGGQVSPEMQMAMQKLQAEIALKQTKAQSDMAIKDAKARQSMAIKDAVAAQAIRNKPIPQ